MWSKFVLQIKKLGFNDLTCKQIYFSVEPQKAYLICPNPVCTKFVLLRWSCGLNLYESSFATTILIPIQPQKLIYIGLPNFEKLDHLFETFKTCLTPPSSLHPISGILAEALIVVATAGIERSLPRGPIVWSPDWGPVLSWGVLWPLDQSISLPTRLITWVKPQKFEPVKSESFSKSQLNTTLPSPPEITKTTFIRYLTQ